MGSVRELLAGAQFGEVTEPNKISLEVRASGEVVAKARTGRISKRVASRRKVGGGFFFFFFFKSVLAYGLDHGETHAAIGAPL